MHLPPYLLCKTTVKTKICRCFRFLITQATNSIALHSFCQQDKSPAEACAAATKAKAAVGPLHPPFSDFPLLPGFLVLRTRQRPLVGAAMAWSTDARRGAGQVRTRHRLICAPPFQSASSVPVRRRCFGESSVGVSGRERDVGGAGRRSESPIHSLKGGRHCRTGR